MAYDALGEVRVKGKQEPIPIFQAVDAELAGDDATPFVGRAAGRPVELADPIETWEILDRQQVLILRERGCTATAITLATRGHERLARRFAQYMFDHDTAGLWSIFGPGLAPVGLDGLERSDTPERLDDLIADLGPGMSPSDAAARSLPVLGP